MDFELLKSIVNKKQILNDAANPFANRGFNTKSFKFKDKRVTVNVDLGELDASLKKHDPTKHLNQGDPNKEDAIIYDFNIKNITFKVIMDDNVYYVFYSFNPPLHFEDSSEGWLDYKTFEKGIDANNPEIYNEEDELEKDKSTLSDVLQIVKDYADDPRVLDDIVEYLHDKSLNL